MISFYDSYGNLLTAQSQSLTLASAVTASDHGLAATDQVVNVCYGTADPPTANTTTEGCLFIKYTA
jgi:hypothetical protein